MISFVKKGSFVKGHYAPALFWLCLACALYIVSRYNYLLYHVLTESFSVIVAIGVFLFAWNLKYISGNSFFLILGISFLFVGFIDLLHTMAYKGMGVFQTSGANVATQLWIGGRYLQSLSLAGAVLFVDKSVKKTPLFLFYASVTALLLLSIFTWKVFPVCYLEGSGLTAFKIISEYLITTIFLACAILFTVKAHLFDRTVSRLVLVSILLNACTEIIFTLYLNVYDMVNLTGHVFKLISFYLIYKAVIEIGLSKPYSLLAGDLHRSRDELRKVLTAVNQSADLVMITDLQGIIEYTNPAFEKVTGFSASEAVGKLPSIVKSDRNDSGTYAALWNTISAGHVFHDVIINRKKDGTLYYEEKTITPVRDELGNITHYISIGRDVTERVRLEQERIARAREHSRSTAELSEFIFAASHDLQEPLRIVTNYSELLAQRYAGSLDDKGGKYIEYIIEGARRIRTQINDLLSFSLIDSSEKQFARTQASRALDIALSNLKAMIDENKAAITSDPLPEVLVDEPQLVQLFQNLIGNAIKFKSNALPRIHICAKPFDKQEDKNPLLKQIDEKESHPWQFSIEDNGIGIDPASLDRIFVLFYKLHGKGVYKGTGIGLAKCKKIVERHGGRIWVESAPGKGSVFHFTLFAVIPK